MPDYQNINFSQSRIWGMLKPCEAYREAQRPIYLLDRQTYSIGRTSIKGRVISLISFGKTDQICTRVQISTTWGLLLCVVLYLLFLSWPHWRFLSRHMPRPWI